MEKVLIALANLLADKKVRDKVLLFIGSIIVGFILLLATPVIALYSMGNVEIEMPEMDRSIFNESAFLAHLSPEQQECMSEIQSIGEAIETKMAAFGIAEQTIKAQLIYMSYFDEVEDFDANFYANIFYYASDDEVLIDSLNQNYGLSIDYNEFMTTYVFVMNATINPYMFTDSSTKNAADLAAWAENAYLSEWQYADNCFGERDGDSRIRCADNVGLIMGYIRYAPDTKTFSTDIDTLIYNEIGGIDTMPDVQGLGVWNGSDFGIYVGGGDVIFSSAMGGVQRQALADGNWTSWCTFEGITYPQEVIDTINEIQNPTEPTMEESTEGE